MHVRSFSGFPARQAPVFPSFLKQTTYCHPTYSLVVYALAWEYLAVSVRPDLVWTSLVMQQSCSDALEDAKKQGADMALTRREHRSGVQREWAE